MSMLPKKNPGDRYISVAQVLTAGVTFLIRAGTPTVLGLLVSLGLYLVTVHVALATIRQELAQVKASGELKLNKETYSANEAAHAQQLENINLLIERQESRTTRIEEKLDRALERRY